MAALTLQHFPGAQGASLPYYGDHRDVFIGDTVSSTKDDQDKPITSGFFRVEKGGKATATYTYFEVKFIVDGVLIVSDDSGQKVKAVKGDVLYFPKGATITFETEEGGVAFFVNVSTF
ncbi:hypothetical protein N7456_004590 [Penicillium angulare]|uniref:(S)-ureidoglycine aminohydrolase cupin domain-containing protein n=1 Tax=Penicillium angulare TaxID=116970 RepID=A0A9W9FXP3_9EURO|nr:hypothetical protein N7456_004590 [Penicillium angulare]